MANLCAKGKYQSPINIKTNTAIKCGATCDLTFYYRTSKANILNTDKNIVLDYDNGSYVMYNSEVYELDKISFTLPANHTIDRHTFPLEINLNHRSPDTGRLLIIAVLFEINDASSKSAMFLDMFADSLPKKAGQQKHVNTPDDWNVFNLIPEIKAFFTYSGSLPRSPCTEDVQWIVFENTSNVNTLFYDAIKPIIYSNARKLKPLNGRVIYYNSNVAEKNGRNYGDRLRCYTEKEFRSACSCLSGDKELLSVKNKQVLMITIIFILIVLFILLILYLIQENFFGKTLEKFSGLLSSDIVKNNKISTSDV